MPRVTAAILTEHFVTIRHLPILCSIISPDPHHLPLLPFNTLFFKKRRKREAWDSVRGHPAGQWWSWDLSQLQKSRSCRSARGLRCSCERDAGLPSLMTMVFPGLQRHFQGKAWGASSPVHFSFKELSEGNIKKKKQKWFTGANTHTHTLYLGCGFFVFCSNLLNRGVLQQERVLRLGPRGRRKVERSPCYDRRVNITTVRGPGLLISLLHMGDEAGGSESVGSRP